MTDHYKHGMRFTAEQIKKLAKGMGVRVAHNHLTGSHVVHLTKRQLNKVKKSSRNGVGMVLRMSPTQIRHNMKGGGIFDTIKDLAWSGAKAIAPKAIDYASGYLKSQIGSGMSLRRSQSKSGKGFFGDLIKGVGSYGVNALAGLAGGRLRKRASRRKSKSGKGIFGDIIRGVGSYGVNALAGLAGGRIRKRRKSKAGSRKRKSKAGFRRRSRSRAGSRRRSKSRIGGSFLPAGYN